MKFVIAILSVVVLCLLVSSASAQCPGGSYPVQQGPAIRVVERTVGVVRHVREKKPVRRVLKRIVCRCH